MNNYYNEIEHLIKKNEINKKSRVLKDNSDTLNTYWNIGRLLVEAQGGKERSKYGNGLIKKWSEKLTKLYGKGYNSTNMKQFRQFYITFPKGRSLSDQLTWTHIRYILPIKNTNERNYYINLIIEHCLGTRELIQAIKNNSYERLLEKPEKIEIITKEDNKVYNIKEHIKNPIIIKLDTGDKVLNEKDLQMLILAKLKNFFEELGMGYAFIGNEIKIKYGSKTYSIDILLFNVESNSYVVVELKLRKLKREDKSQIEFYMKLVDDNLKRNFHNSTKGIIVSKEQDKFIATFVGDDDIIPITYKLK